MSKRELRSGGAKSSQYYARLCLHRAKFFSFLNLRYTLRGVGTSPRHTYLAVLRSGHHEHAVRAKARLDLYPIVHEALELGRLRAPWGNRRTACSNAVGARTKTQTSKCLCSHVPTPSMKCIVWDHICKWQNINSSRSANFHNPAERAPAPDCNELSTRNYHKVIKSRSPWRSCRGRRPVTESRSSS